MPYLCVQSGLWCVLLKALEFCSDVRRYKGLTARIEAQNEFIVCFERIVSKEETSAFQLSCR